MNRKTIFQISFRGTGFDRRENAAAKQTLGFKWGITSSGLLRFTSQSLLAMTVGLLVTASVPQASAHAQVSEKTISTVDRAMADELTRDKAELHMPGLVDPFFIAYTVCDQQKLDLIASNGSLTKSEATHARNESVRLLLNNYQFDDENFTDNTGFFNFNSSPDNSLPLDDDYMGIRRALWLSTDALFKDANDNFSKKKAALQHKELSPELRDLPDFAHAPAIHITEEPVAMNYNRTELETMVKNLSAIFTSHREIQSSNISLTLYNSYEWIQNTEGTNVRKPATLCELKVQATAQAASDGEPLVLSRTFVAKLPGELPSEAELTPQIEELAKELVALRTAPTYDEEYTGPVLFEDEAASDYLSENLISRLFAERQDVLGNDVSAIFASGKRSSLKDRIGTRILSMTSSIRDISELQAMNGVDLLGYYPFDDEGVVPTPDMILVDKGILKTLYMTRTPTKEVRETNGHCRTLSAGMPGVTESAPAPGVVEYIDSKAVPFSGMEKDLLKRAKEDGYDYAFIVRSIEVGAPPQDAGFSIQDMLANGKHIVPLLIYKVFADGHEQLIRGAEIGLPSIRDLREMISSKERVTQNMLISAGSGGLFSFSPSVPATLIGPRYVLAPALDVQKKQPEAYPTPPVVERPE